MSFYDISHQQSNNLQDGCLTMIKTALISVSDKAGIIGLARQLQKSGVKMLSTGNTAELLKRSGIKVALVSEITKFPEMLNGRVKSLHPNIFAGILADRKNKGHLEELNKAGAKPIETIDMVVVNFYPFEEFPNIENIDIGGPSLVRAAAKNYENVLVVVEPEDYGIVIEKIKRNNLRDNISYEERLNFAAKAFSHTARYDTIIANYFNAISRDKQPNKLPLAPIMPDILNLTFKKIQDLRYGENPYQTASFYSDMSMGQGSVQSCVSSAKQLQGKELSFNNILDVDAAFELAKEFEKPTAVIVKHTNPSGVASDSTIEEAYRKAHETDPKSAFGGIVALNRNCNLKTAKLIEPLFIEAVICPKFEQGALQALKEKKALRLLETGDVKYKTNAKFSKSCFGYDLKKVTGGLLAQAGQCPEISEKSLKVVSRRSPTKKELNAMGFAWKVNKHVKSNSIVLAKEDVTVGIGAGQMSRVDAVKLAVIKSEGNVKGSKGSVMSSDAFFPFRDGVDEAAKAGVTAIIQPGGSIRDKEVIAAADEHNIAMVFTGVRLFRH